MDFRIAVLPTSIFARFAGDVFGATAIEYSLVASLISVACIGAMAAVGNSLLGYYTAINTALVGAL